MRLTRSCRADPRRSGGTWDQASGLRSDISIVPKVGTARPAGFMGLTLAVQVLGSRIWRQISGPPGTRLSASVRMVAVSRRDGTDPAFRERPGGWFSVARGGGAPGAQSA